MTMRISHEAIYQALFVQGRGGLRRELTACLRRADSSGRRSGARGGVTMTRCKRRSDRSGRAPLPSPGRPPVAGREELRGFWAAIAAGLSSEDAAASANVPPAVGARWFRKA